ncbi:hypothetical protein P170DRAFT_382369 [Aspergillus steynii IBT 23096]|uniref:Protection of telomeres protein 1 n=1 Tax=Aspergillus steynii IBT 23096 TaxID=1392250 RepID=A0A2I2GE07_9EURO|nr:uncharacterized protein P170DRAFT_382369 [Aspergillus steynii IBT 23096]PLB51128.1 hypothetical protein P170DRAFT_382369 [Aspergillus steynii IBT 23096]
MGWAELVDISTALSTRDTVTVVGVVVDVPGTPKQTKGNSFFITFTLKDSDLTNGHTWDGLKIRYFRDNESQLPPVQVGDVVLLRNIHIKQDSREILGVAAQYKTIPWALFRHNPDPMSSMAPMCGPTPFEPNFTEKKLALSLLEKSPKAKEYRKPSVDRVASQSHLKRSTFSTRDCFTLVKDAKYKTHVDLIGEVVKIYPPSGFRDNIVMYVTDYTTNRLLPDHDSDDDERGREGDEFNYQRFNRRRWTGPSGQRSIAVTVWAPHSSFVQERVNEGDLIYLRNAFIKQSNTNRSMEAVIETGNSYDAKNCKIRLVNAKDDDRAKELLRRKKEYLIKNPSKRKLAQDDEPTTRSKRANKQPKQKAEAKEENQTSIVFRKQNPPNPEIITAYSSCSDRPIEDIIANESHNNVSPDGIEYRFPFQNLCYRSIVRVVDFFPHTLEDFAVPERQDDRSLSSYEREDATGEPFNRWEWRFCLLVESSYAPAPGQTKEQMKLFVYDAEAVHLLGIDACDLRKKPDELERVREKLFILWGDLEEQKRKAAGQSYQVAQDSKAVSSRSFACCIQEYGIMCSHRVAAGADQAKKDDGVDSCSHEGCFGWERRFAMYRTKIR